MRKIHALTLILGATLAAAANSATTGTSFSVTETVLSTCSATASTLAFSPYTPGGGAVANNSTISVKCTKKTPLTVALNGGTTTGGTVAQRLLAQGTNTLQYNLFTTAAFTQVFGDGTGTSKT